MHLLGARRLAGRLTLTRQVALLSLVPIVALGFVLTRVLETQIVTRTLADAEQSAQLIARIGIQPRLSPAELRNGLSPASVRQLDQQLSTRSVTRDLARIKIWNSKDKVVYSDLHGLIGRTLKPSDELVHALEGRPNDAAVVNPSPHNETAAEVGLGTLVEVYVPLRFTETGPPAGAFEIYLSYRPIAGALSADKRTIAMLVVIGLAVLWAILFRIVAGAARRLKRQAEENYRLARYDPLTGLPNRMQFTEAVSDALRRERPARGSTAVLLIDLDGFKEINNTLGNPLGDRVLCEVGARLTERFGQDAVVARLGADEYAIVQICARGVAGALEIASRAQASLEAPIVLNDVALNVEASIGIAVIGEHAEDLDTLLRRADVALAFAKAHFSRVEVYSPDHDRFDASRLKLLGEVRSALDRGEFVLHYQPKIDLKSRRIVGVEALLRWQHPEQGLLPPLKFIPALEQTALIGPVTLFVLAESLRQMVAWRKLGFDLEMAVNLSARNLGPELPAEIRRLLHAHGIAPEQLTVEITESATMADPERAVRVLQTIRASGLGVSIDDFGTGNASIEYLARLPASELKIDRSLIIEMASDPRAEAIVRSTIDLARHLELHVVAEGIETEEVLERVAALGCDTAQGYFIARPLPAAELTDRLLGGFRGARAATPREGAPRESGLRRSSTRTRS